MKANAKPENLTPEQIGQARQEVEIRDAQAITESDQRHLDEMATVGAAHSEVVGGAVVKPGTLKRKPRTVGLESSTRVVQIHQRRDHK